MNFKAFFVKKILISFFITTTCITAAMAVLGLLFDANRRFGYEAYLYPIVFGIVSTIPSLITYSKKDLSLKSMFVRNVINFFFIEIIITSILYFGGAISDMGTMISVVITIFIVYLTVNLVLWTNDKKTAKELTKALKKLQDRGS